MRLHHVRRIRVGVRTALLTTAAIAFSTACQPADRATQPTGSSKASVKDKLIAGLPTPSDDPFNTPTPASPAPPTAKRPCRNTDFRVNWVPEQGGTAQYYSYLEFTSRSRVPCRLQMPTAATVWHNGRKLPSALRRAGAPTPVTLAEGTEAGILIDVHAVDYRDPPHRCTRVTELRLEIPGVRGEVSVSTTPRLDGVGRRVQLSLCDPFLGFGPLRSHPPGQR